VHWISLSSLVLFFDSLSHSPSSHAMLRNVTITSSPPPHPHTHIHKTAPPLPLLLPPPPLSPSTPPPLTPPLPQDRYNNVGPRYHKWVGSSGPRTLAFELTLTANDGTTTTILSDTQWETSDGPITFNGVYVLSSTSYN
jgi:hypothetical protein